MATATDIDAAISAMRELVRAGGNGCDIDYWHHEPRYRRTLRRVCELVPPGSTILDVGSHYLHLSSVLSLLGYHVLAMDVPEFAQDPFIRARAQKFGIDNHSVARLDGGEFLAGRENAIDFVLFCEIQEHITFNPVRFWKRIYELLSIGGRIYMTTPNGMNTWQVLSNLKRLILLQGAGPSIPSILGNVTFGHHWKEYSGPEIRELFALLSPDFSVEISFFEMHKPSAWTSAKALVRDLTQRTSALVPSLRDQIEAVITLTGRTSWLATPPEFI
jgi:2-polyprenyl-6-hydroxyphenyl methylase/3-demethylubiquinone-9 3-methyltransferase